MGKTGRALGFCVKSDSFAHKINKIQKLIIPTLEMSKDYLALCIYKLLYR